MLKNLRCFFHLAILLLFAATAFADTIYNNFGPGNSYQNSTGTAWAVGGSGESGNAVSFVVPMTASGEYQLTEVQFAANWSFGTNLLTVGLFGPSNDINTASLLETWTVSANAQSTPQLFDVAGNATLLSGQTYYIEMEGNDPNTEWGWQWNDQMQNGYYSEFAGGQWFLESGVTPVLEISANPVQTTTPEPGTFMLLASGILGTAEVVRRKRI